MLNPNQNQPPICQCRNLWFVPEGSGSRGGALHKLFIHLGEANKIVSINGVHIIVNGEGSLT